MFGIPPEMCCWAISQAYFLQITDVVYFTTQQTVVSLINQQFHNF